MKRKKTKKALSGSVLALVLCFVMLIGTTFAWFTSSDSTAVNKIEAGTLDVDLMMKEDGKWVSATNKTLNFTKATDGAGQDILWEPGCTYTLPTIQVVNNGNLALKYKVVVSAVLGDGNLAEVLDVICYDSTKASLGNVTVGTLNDILNSTDKDGFAHGNLTAKGTAGDKSGEITLSLHMQELAGNAYQGKSIKGLTVTVYATQETVEYDSNGNTYDKDATLPDVNAVPVASATELTAAIANGGSVVLTDDITVDDVVSIAKDITIYGNGNTITAATGKDRIFNVQEQTGDISIELYNLTMDASSAERGISFYNNSGKVALLVDNCNITAHNYAINVASDNTDITVTVKNSNITGYCAAQTWSANSKLTFTNCTLNGVNTFSGNDNVFGTVVVSKGATGSVFNFNDCTITASHTDAMHYLFDVLDDATINVTDCTLTSNGTAVTADNYTSYCYTAGGVTANITITES